MTTDPGLILALEALATEAAASTARLVADRVGGDLGAATKSSATDVVTEVDTAAEHHLVELLLGARPDDAVMGEEGADHAGTSGVRWILDPIDGTTNFVYGHPGYAVSVAAELHGTVVAGAVADVARAELFAASAGNGARLDGRPISATHAADLALALVATGFGYDPERRRRQAEVLTRLLPRVRDIRRMGS
ncbi:MAG: inositol monophosphatase, partial [Dehalococcoidia bacterium]|nr:inositol monophosphatase [Dehalococcoidia bacterium]